MRKHLPHALLLIAITFLVWGTSLWNGFVWDDRILIVKNERTISTLSLSTAFFSDFWSTETDIGSSNYYRPLVTLSYMLDYAVYGLNPAGYHFTNIAIHAASVVILGYILLLVGLSVNLAMSAAILWAIHPVAAESVAWISGRTDSLATLFMLLSVASGLRAWGKKSDPRMGKLSAAMFGCALLCKESAFVTPAFLLLLLTYVGKRTKFDRSAVVAFSVAGLLWFGLRCMVLARPVGVESGEGVSPTIGILSLLHVWGNLIWPPVFRIEYGSPLTSQTLMVGAALGALLIAWMVFVMAADHGPRITRYLYLAGLIAFVPSVMAVLLKSMIGSRLLYTAAAFALPGFALGLRLDERSAVWKRAYGGVLVVLASIAVLRAQLWRDDARLFSEALAAPDASTRNHLNLGIALYDAGDFVGALDHLSRDMERAALEQKHYMLGLLYTAIGCESLAEKNFLESLEADPTFFSAAHNLAGLHTLQGRHDEARMRLSRIAELAPQQRAKAMTQIDALASLGNLPRREPTNGPWCSDSKALNELFKSAVGLNRLAGEHLRSGQLELGEVLVQGALRVDPWFVAARLNLAQVYLVKGDKERARAALEELLATNPDEERARRLLARLSEMP